MNETAWLAFVITPAIVIALGWGAALLHLYYSPKDDEAPPAE